MQLIAGPCKDSLAATIGALAAGLLAIPAQAQDVPGAQSPSVQPQQTPTDVPAGAIFINAYDQTASEIDTQVLDSAVLFYQEDGGRVRAIEAESGLTWTRGNGTVLSGKFTYDSLTGATPNGAIRSVYPQSFLSPTRLDGKTGASGAYDIPPGQLPVDKRFKDHREAVDLSATLPLSPRLKISFGGAASWETDFTSYSARVGFSRDMNAKNTTLSFSVNVEGDTSTPFYGVPQPLGDMGSTAIALRRHKSVISLVGGITQVLTPEWLVQLNYNVGFTHGYQTDPYKLVSLVDRDSGDPFFSIYETRPETRTRHSVYGATKFALGSFVTDAALRWYHDSWGIGAITASLSEHVPVGRSLYVEPEVRWYHQSAARFYSAFLYADQDYPAYASADSRLGRFGAWTFGAKVGAHLSNRFELYAVAERYRQYGLHVDPGLPGDLATTDLFAGSQSTSVIGGLRVTFR